MKKAQLLCTCKVAFCFILCYGTFKISRLVNKKSDLFEFDAAAFEKAALSNPVDEDLCRNITAFRSHSFTLCVHPKEEDAFISKTILEGGIWELQLATFLLEITSV